MVDPHLGFSFVSFNSNEHAVIVIDKVSSLVEVHDGREVS